MNKKQLKEADKQQQIVVGNFKHHTIDNLMLSKGFSNKLYILFSDAISLAWSRGVEEGKRIEREDVI